MRALRTTAAALVAAATTAAALFVSPTPAAAQTVVPKVTLGVLSGSLTPGAELNIPVRFATKRVGTIDWRAVGLPSGVGAVLGCSSATRCTINLRAGAAVFGSSSLVTFRFSNPASVRTATIRLTVVAPPPPPPTVAPPATVAPPPPAPAPTTPVATTAAPTTTVATAQNFVIRPDNIIATGLPNGNVTFGLAIDRTNWVGPVTFATESLPNTWRAAFLPANPTATGSTAFVVSVPSGTANGDYPVRVSARSATMRFDLSLVVRVRFVQINLTVVSAPTQVIGGTSQAVVDARSVDEPTRPVTLSVDGLPSGVVASTSTNPFIGQATVTFSVPASTPAGTYPITFVGTSGGEAVRVASQLVVVAGVTFQFLPTAVLNAETRGYALSANTGTVTVGRGVQGTFDVTVAPKGGFIDPISVSMDMPSGWGVAYTGIAANVFRVTVSVPTSATPGSYPLTLRTASGSFTANLGVGFVVT